MRVGLVFGGRSVEHRVSLNSARTVATALADAGHEVVALGIAQDGCWLDATASRAALADDHEALEATGESIRESFRHFLSADIDVVFPVVHGTWGEDGTLQGLCEMLDVPYVGADVTASALAMDKLQCKRLLASLGVPVVDYEAVTASEFERSPQRCLERLIRLGMPVFVKPSCGGSSVGVQRIADSQGLAPALEFALHFDDTVIVEKAILGRELECSVLGAETLEASTIGEIVPGNDFYDYEDKYLQDEAELRVPASLPSSEAEKVKDMAVRAFAVIGGCGMARVDFLMDGEGGLWVNEINTLPGFTRISMYPKLWEKSGVPLPELVDRLVQIAVGRHQRRSQLDEAIKTWLASIAS